MIDLTSGIAVDAAHSNKNRVTEFQGIDLRTGERVFYENLGYQTINIGEFLAIVEAVKWINKNNYTPRVIFSDSMVAIRWFKNKRTASDTKCLLLQKAEIYLKTCSSYIDDIKIIHWDNKEWGETPADFGNKSGAKSIIRYRASIDTSLFGFNRFSDNYNRIVKWIDDCFGGDEDEFCESERLSEYEECKLTEHSKSQGLSSVYTGRGYLFIKDRVF